MIEIENLKFKYSSSASSSASSSTSSSTKWILDIPHFRLKRSEKVFLYGPSGCGKTTFLEILAGINIPQEGSIRINNELISKMNSAQRDKFRADHMGYIFQSFNLIPYLTVAENITLPLYLSENKRKHILPENELQRTHEICQFLGIEKFLEQPVTELSVGQQQRVAAARAILGQPELILADEPTSSLDFDHREKFIKLLFELCEKQKTTVLFVSHDRSLEKLFDRSMSLPEVNKAVATTQELV